MTEQIFFVYLNSTTYYAYVGHEFLIRENGTLVIFKDKEVVESFRNWTKVVAREF